MGHESGLADPKTNSVSVAIFFFFVKLGFSLPLLTMGTTVEG